MVEPALQVQVEHYIPASDQNQLLGLLGWVRLVVSHAVVVDGITVRRTRDGQLRLSFPERRDRRDNRHPIVRPVNAAARLHIESQVFAALGLDQGATP